MGALREKVIVRCACQLCQIAAVGGVYRFSGRCYQRRPSFRKQRRSDSVGPNRQYATSVSAGGRAAGLASTGTHFASRAGH